MSSPLADRLRPEKIEDMVGQKHLLAEGMPLRNILNSGTLPNLIFYGHRQNDACQNYSKNHKPQAA